MNLIGFVAWVVFGALLFGVLHLLVRSREQCIPAWRIFFGAMGTARAELGNLIGLLVIALLYLHYTGLNIMATAYGIPLALFGFLWFQRDKANQRREQAVEGMLVRISTQAAKRDETTSEEAK